MIDAPGFGPRIGWASIVLGAIAAGAALVLLIDPLSFIAVVGVLALILFHIVVGRRVFGLARA